MKDLYSGLTITSNVSLASFLADDWGLIPRQDAGKYELAFLRPVQPLVLTGVAIIYLLQLNASHHFLNSYFNTKELIAF